MISLKKIILLLTCITLSYPLLTSYLGCFIDIIDVQHLCTCRLKNKCSLCFMFHSSTAQLPKLIEYPSLSLILKTEKDKR